MTLVFGCQSLEHPKITTVDLVKSEFIVLDVNYSEQIIKWNNFSTEEQSIILEWVKYPTDRLKISIITYAPNIIIKGEKYNVNFTGDLVVYNYKVNSGKWLQGVRKRNTNDLKVMNCILNRIKKF
jgi:hypothetical protein